MSTRWGFFFILLAVLLAPVSQGVAQQELIDHDELIELRPSKAPIFERLLTPDRVAEGIDPWIDDQTYTTYRRVNWRDFRYRRSSWSTRPAGLSATVMLDRVAATGSEVDGGWEVRPESYRVYALMNKLESSFRPARRGKATLAHEQGHFDLAEACARRFRLEVSALRAWGPTSQDAERGLESLLRRAYRDVRERLDHLHELYDFETLDGRRRREQKEWDETLRTALEGGLTPICSLDIPTPRPRPVATRREPIDVPQPPSPPATHDAAAPETPADLAEATKWAHEEGLLGIVYFPFDSSTLDFQARDRLARNADFLREYPQYEVTIEGHCDERGTNEYNIALGARRSDSARDFLTSQGIEGERLRSVSFGEERPDCVGSGESCWRLNRRATFQLTGKR